MTLQRLKDRVALVTGAGRGIGRAIALAFAAEGATVGVIDISGEDARTVAADAYRFAGRGIPLEIDVAERTRVHAGVQRLVDDFGRIDVLVNNAMWVRYEPITEVAEETVDRMLGVGLKAMIWTMQAAAPHMAARRRGSIVNIASPAAEIGVPGAAVYCATKGGIAALTRQAATELGRQGIRVNCISPGPIPTPGANRVVDKAGWQARRERTPLGRLGTVEEIASAAVFLASDESRFVNGDTIRVDGGLTIAAL